MIKKNSNTALSKILMAGVAVGALSSAAAPALADEIIVTATKRPQTLREVPVAVSVVDADTIEKSNVRDLIDIQTNVPSLRVTQLQNSSQTNFVIRGFGNGANNPGIESSVGVFIDGVFRSRSASAILDLPTLERVEILRGPQSTLFGKNTSAGAISITTKAPEFDLGGSVSATYGNFDQINFKGTLTGPLSDTLAFRISGSYNNRDGYYTNLADGSDVNERDRWAVRGQLLWEPTDVLAFRLIGEYNKIEEDCCGAIQILNGPVTLGIGAPMAVGGLGRLIGSDADPFAREVAFDLNPSNELTGKGVSLQADWDLGAVAVTSITAYREQDDNTDTDADFSSADVLTNPQTRNYQTFTQEIRLSSVGDNQFDWMIGGFYFDEKVDFTRDVIWGSEGRLFADFLTTLAGSPGALGGIEASLMLPAGTFFADGQGVFGDYNMDNRSYSFFGQVEFDLTERLTLSGGVSYINDRKETVGISTLTDVFSGSIDLNALGFPGTVFALTGVDILTAPPAVVAATLAAPFPVAGPAPAFAIDPSTGVPLADPQTVASYATAVAGTTCFAPNPALLCNPANSLAAFQFFAPQVNFPDPGNPLDNGLLEDDKVTYTVRLAYDVTDSINSYFTYSTGWKAGAVNLSSDSRPPDAAGVGRTARPEDVTLYELGIKANFDGGFFNVAIFDQTIKDFQSNLFVGTGFVLANAEEQSVRGFEIDAAITPMDPLYVTFGLTYLDPEFDSFTSAPCTTFAGVSVPACAPDPVTGFQVPSFDASGFNPAGIHPISLSASATWTHDFANGDQGFIRAEYIHESDAQVVDNVSPTIASRNVSVLNASIGYQMENGVEIMAWGRNLTDDEYFLSAFPSVGQAGSFSGYTNAPRTYGVTARMSF